MTKTSFRDAGRIQRGLRIVWTITSLVLVEAVICGLSAFPSVVLWQQLTRIAVRNLIIRSVFLSCALIPSYIIFALILMFVSPLAVRFAGWRTPLEAEMDISGVEWPLLNWVRYAVSNYVVRMLAGIIFRGSPLWTSHLRLAGARIGRRVYINSLGLNDYNLLEFGDGVVIGADVHLSGHTVEAGIVKTAAVRLGPNTTVGLSSIVEIGVETGPNCNIGALSFVPKWTKLEGDATYAGIPAKRIQ